MSGDRGRTESAMSSSSSSSAGGWVAMVPVVKGSRSSLAAGTRGSYQSTSSGMSSASASTTTAASDPAGACAISPLLAGSVAGVLAATAAERIAFKMLVDRLTPYRLVLAETILVVSVCVYGLITVLKRGMTNRITSQMSLFPHSKLIIMALLDTIQFSCLVVAGAGVTPTMTVILLHASTPALVFGSKFIFPERNYTDQQVRGVYLIIASLVISLGQQASSLSSSSSSNTFSGALSSFIYVGAAALHGLSNLYKEHALVEWMQPVDVHFLNSWLFFYQAIICIVLAPAIYALQGLTAPASGPGFPLSSMFVNIQDGRVCVHGQDPLWIAGGIDDDESRVAVQRSYDTKYTECSHSFWLVLLFVVSNVGVLECVDRILQTGNQMLGRATSAAVLVAFVTLGVYDLQADVGSGLFGTTIGVTDVLSLIVLLGGLELYGRDSTNNDGIQLVQLTQSDFGSISAGGGSGSGEGGGGGGRAGP